MKHYMVTLKDVGYTGEIRHMDVFEDNSIDAGRLAADTANCRNALFGCCWREIQVEEIAEQDENPIIDERQIDDSMRRSGV